MTQTITDAEIAEGADLSDEFFSHLFKKLDAVLVEEDEMHPFGCAAWLEVANCAVDEAKFAVTELRAKVAATARREAALREALEWYANPQVYKPHPDGSAFDRRDLSFCARAALEART